jgi:isoleucyl-tRNA synthetase
LGKQRPAVQRALAKADGAAILRQLETHGRVTLDSESGAVELDRDDIQVRLEAKAGWTAAQGSSCVVVLSTALTPELIREGLARDLNRFIQDRRKDLNCQFTDRIEIGMATTSHEIQTAIQENLTFIVGETLAVSLTLAPLNNVDPVELDIGGERVTLYVRVVPGA